MSAFRLLAASAALCCATALQGISVAAAAPSKIFYGAPLSAVWANDGADKVTQDETRRRAMAPL